MCLVLVASSSESCMPLLVNAASSTFLSQRRSSMVKPLLAMTSSPGRRYSRKPWICSYEFIITPSSTYWWDEHDLSTWCTWDKVFNGRTRLSGEGFVAFEGVSVNSRSHVFGSCSLKHWGMLPGSFPMVGDTSYSPPWGQASTKSPYLQ